MRSILLIICLLLSANGTFARGLKFLEPSWNFGTIAEDGGEVAHTFEFVNSSSLPVVITSVKTSCGCTTTQYSRRPIGVGEKSTFEVVYDPMYRPGAFARNISIFTSASTEAVVVTITGDVTPRKLSVSEQYPYLLGGGVRITSLYSFMQNVSPNSPRQSQIELFNDSNVEQTIKFSVVESSGFLNIDAPKSISAGESAKVNLSYEISSNASKFGELNDLVDIYIGGKKSNMTLRTRAYAIEDLDYNSKKGVARGQFSENFINFALLNISTSDLVREFTIENSGTEPLYIRSIDLPQGVEISSQGRSLEGTSIASADIITVRVTLRREELEVGSFVKYATIILNDPESPVVRLKIVGEVSK
ncbi:MAG: DUF1573 domain-containing protein [Rikenellaceae bacterium]